MLRATLESGFRISWVIWEAMRPTAANLSERLGNRVLMKREDLQPVFSFKLRGAYNKIAGLDATEVANGVICSSAGNHAPGGSSASSRATCSMYQAPSVP